MALTIKPAYATMQIAFRNSAAPLGTRNQEDLKYLLLLAYFSNRADYVNLFVSPPTLDELLGNAPGGGGADLTVATLLALLSPNGNVMATLDGDQIRYDLNAILDAPGGLLTVNGFPNFIYGKGEIDSKLAAIMALIGSGGDNEAATIAGRLSLIDWFSAESGAGIIAGAVDTLTGKKGNIITAPSVSQRLGYDATGGPTGGAVFNCAEPLVLVGDLPIPDTLDMVVWAVIKSTGGSTTSPFRMDGAYDGEFFLSAKYGSQVYGYTHGPNGYGESGDNPMSNNVWNIVRMRVYRSEPAGQQIKIEVNGVEGVIGSEPDFTNFFSSVMNLRFGAQSAGGNYGFDGQMTDLLIFGAKETAAEKAFLYNYLKTKTGL